MWRDAQANISLLFGDLPFERRPAAAAAAGFASIECWWPFATATPPQRDVDHFVASVVDAGVHLRALNFYAGDMSAGERGIVSHPARRQEFDDSVAVATEIGVRLGVRAFNALYGLRLPDLGDTAQHAAAIDALVMATEQVDCTGATVLVEPVSGLEAYPIKLGEDALRVADNVGRHTRCGRIALLADLYHLTVNGDDLGRLFARAVDRIGHVQIADAPGRHEPGTGTADVIQLVDTLVELGYRGGIGLEYVPSGDTVEGLQWWRELTDPAGDHVGSAGLGVTS